MPSGWLAQHEAGAGLGTASGRRRSAYRMDIRYGASEQQLALNRLRKNTAESSDPAIRRESLLIRLILPPADERLLRGGKT